MAIPRPTADPRRSTEDATRLERQLATAQALTHIGSWEWDIATNRVTWSDELYRIYGLEPQSCTVTFESFLARVHAEDREHVQKQVSLALEHGTRVKYIERIFRPDGSMRTLDSMGEPTFDGAGRVSGLIGTCRDVTLDRERDQQLQLFADIVENVQIALSVWSVSDPNDPGSMRLTAYNPAAEELARLPLAGTIGRSLGEILPFTKDGALESLILRVARDRAVRETAILGSRDRENPQRSVSLKAFPLAGKLVGVAFQDITVHVLAQQMTAAEQTIFEMIAEAAPLQAILKTLVSAIDEQSPFTIASILLLEPDGKHLCRGIAPRLPEEYSRAIEGAEIGPKAGSCGTAAWLRKSVLVTDIETDPLWDDYREIARAAELRACWSTPILATDGRVLGTFALYYREPRGPNEQELALLERATHIAGIAIERRQLEEELHALSAHVESAREEERTGIAREIHDELGQALTALKMDLAWLSRRAQSGSDFDRGAILERVGEMSSMTDQIIDQVRRISSDLRPGVLDDLGLFAALEWQAQEFQRRSGISCIIRSDVNDGAAFHPELSTNLFRIFQEALTNVARHGAAAQVDVRLETRSGWLELEVSDDGKGIAPEAVNSSRSLGLVGIRERARRLGGSATVARALPTGTVVLVRVPLEKGAA